MTNVRTIHVDWYSQRPPRFDGGPQLAYQGDHLSNMVVFDNAPVLPNYYLLVEMKLTEYGKIVTLPAIMLEGPYWVIPNYYTQICQILTYQVCERTETGDYEHHSAKFYGTILPSIAHLNDPTTQESMFDPYMAVLDKRVKDLIDEHGEIVIDEETAAEAINSWLDDHPEATTTIEDGAVSEVKLSSELKPKVINAYVTPEMFGGVGDGSSDDTNAIRSAFATGKNVYFTKGKTYAISSPITVSSSVEITNGAVIKAIAQMQSVFIITAPSDSFRFIGGTINCNQLADYGIYADTLGGAYIQDVKVVDAVEACIYIGGGYHNWIANCKLYNNNTLATGIYNKSADLKVIGTEIYYTSLAIDQRSGILVVSTSHFWSGGASNASETSTAIKITISSSGALARVFLSGVYFDSFYQCVFTERLAHIKASSCLFYWAATTTPKNCYGLVIPVNSIWKLSACMFQTVNEVNVTDILYDGYGLCNTEPQTSVASLFTTPQATQVIFNAHVKDGFLYIDFVLDMVDVTEDSSHQVPIIVSAENLPYWTFQRMDGTAYNLTQHNAVPIRLSRSVSTGVITIHCGDGLTVGDRIEGGISVQLRG